MLNRFMHASALLCLLICNAFAANTVLTPLVAPETGEASMHQAEVLDVARFKPGFGTGTCAVSSSACAVTINNAAGLISGTTVTAGASGATPSVMTVTDSKVQTGDMVLCSVDSNGATAAAVITCIPHITANGTFTITLYSAGTTALSSSSLKVFFLVLTQGNPN